MMSDVTPIDIKILKPQTLAATDSVSNANSTPSKANVADHDATLSDSIEAERQRIFKAQALIETVRLTMDPASEEPLRTTLETAYEFLDTAAAELEVIADRINEIMVVTNA